MSFIIWFVVTGLIGVFVVGLAGMLLGWLSDDMTDEQKENKRAYNLKHESRPQDIFGLLIFAAAGLALYIWANS